MSTEVSQHPLHVSYVHSIEQQEETIDHGAKERLASDCEVAIGSRHERDVDGGMGNTHYDEELADQQPGPSDNPGPTDDLITTINKLQTDINSFFAKWLEELSPSEEFELLCPSRVNQLLKEAYSLEEALHNQKERIRSKLTALNDVLKLSIK